MPERDAPAVRIHVARLVALLQAGIREELEDDGGKRLVDLDHLDVIPAETRFRERALARFRVAVEHHVRVDAREAEREKASAWLEPELRRALLRGDEHRGRAVHDLRGVARSDDGVGNERGLML